MVKVRFAPSPTGFLHIGGARTALFNFLYARAQGGSFVLRIEDTDRERSKSEYLDEILDSMRWLGFAWDEFYKQSDRFDFYRSHAEQLLDSGKAYKDGEAVILPMPQTEIKFFDLIRGEVAFDPATIKDQVLMKSDGSPTYSFACVVDDSLMEITHVIRGEDHISNTPKQIAIYQALGFKAPKFAHLPLIMDEEGGRMSKRTGATAVSDYRKNGFLPEALVNYLMLLGWSPGENQEMISLESAIKKFSIKKVNKAAAAFSMDKLHWLNAQYLKQKSDEDLVAFVAPFLKERGLIDENFDGQRLKTIVHLYKNRMADIEEFVERTRYFFVDDFSVPDALRQENFVPDKTRHFSGLSDRLQGVDPFDAAKTEEAFRSFVDQAGLKTADLVHPVRVALTGSDVGPGLFETMEALGKEKTLKR
ncbi:MAG TPA: glutamate--tRNA ligase, partial [Candidatus Bathyarchaeia archaeon]|nr:glutamate--tRNA ligase [Candidatus Bathyarchaeia archaeon]